MRAIAVMIGFLVTLSGCADSESQPTQEASELPDYLVEALGPQAKAVASGAADWTVLDAVAGPASPVLAYTLDLDPAAVVDSIDYEGQATAVLELAALLPTDGVVEALAIQAFVETAQGLVAAGGFYDPTLHMIVEEAGAAAEEYTRAPPMTPVLLKLGSGLVDDAERIHIIVATTANETFQYGLGLRTLASDLAFGDQLPDTEAFLQAVQGAPLLLAPVAQGTGLEIAAHLDLSDGLDRLRAFSDYVDIQQRDPVPDLIPQPRFDRAVSAGLDSEGGYASVFSLFEGGAGSGEWSLTGDLRGVPLDASGQYSNANPTGLPLPTDALASSPLLMAHGDGLGTSTSTFDVNLASAGERSQIVYFQADIGTSIEELLGLPVLDLPLTDGASAAIRDGCRAQAGGPGLPTLVAEFGC